MKVGDEVFIRALEVRGTVVAFHYDDYCVRYDAGKRGHLTETFGAEDLEPLNEGKCDHHWNNGGNDPTECLKCGMSFIRYVHMECP